jgi:UDP-N-acetylmuramoylalanine--D-glutamate ligase
LREAGVEIRAGADGLDLLDRVRCVVKSPGVPREAAVIIAALERGIPVLGEMELAWRMLAQDFVAVTGTNGKTTTSWLLGAIYDAAGLPVEVAGNVGRAASELTRDALSPDTTIVCEASSFQLEDTLAFAPDAAVLLNIEPDHLDRHHSLARYTEAKLRIFANQPPGAVAVISEELAELATGGAAQRVLFGQGEQCALRLRDRVLRWHGEELIAVSDIRLRGPVQNAMAAASVALVRGVDPAAVRAALVGFAGIVHRIEEVATLDGVLYVNDSKATNIASTIVALSSFNPGSVQLIAGGQGKGQDFGLLREAVATYADHTYTIGEDAEQIAVALAGLPLTTAETLERAVALARERATPGSVILLSPACASFDQFADFEARGERFRALVAGQA